MKTHGSGYGIDLFTEAPTGTNYILNIQDKLRFVDGPSGTGACVPFSQVEIFREKLISKGGVANASLIIQSTFMLDSFCRPNFDLKIRLDCRG